MKKKIGGPDFSLFWPKFGPKNFFKDLPLIDLIIIASSH